MKSFFSFLVFAFALLLSFHSTAQVSVSTGYKAYQIVFQMTSGDTLAHKALMKQLGNISTVSPDSRVEVICHGPGLDMLHQDRSVVGPRIADLASRGIVFKACEFSLKERQVTREQLLSSAGTVPYGILHIVGRQEEGWQYIKAGF